MFVMFMAIAAFFALVGGSVVWSEGARVYRDFGLKVKKARRGPAPVGRLVAIAMSLPWIGLGVMMFPTPIRNAFVIGFLTAMVEDGKITEYQAEEYLRQRGIE